MFAVIKSGGKQYRIAANDVIKVDRIPGEAGDKVEIGEVLLVGNGDDTTVGAPLVEGAKIVAEIVEQGRGPKVIAFKKRRRQNSKRKRGFRAELTTLRVSEILTAGSAPKKKASKAKATDAAPAADEAASAE